MELITKDWARSPIIDIKAINQTTDGKTVKSRLQRCPDGYELSAEALWWGTKRGCICSKTGLHTTLQEACSSEMLAAGCVDSPYIPEQKVNVIDGFTYCIKRDYSYNYLNISRPVNVTDSKNATSYVCKDPAFKKMCGQQKDKFSNVYCIPQSS